MTSDEIRALANLARIEVADEEVAMYAKDFDAILGYVQQINSVDMADIERKVLEKNKTRADAHPNKSGSQTDILLAAAPESQDGFYKVPKIL